MRNIALRFLLIGLISVLPVSGGLVAQEVGSQLQIKPTGTFPAKNPDKNSDSSGDKLSQITPPSEAWMVSKAKPDLAFGAYQRGYFVTAFKEAMKRIEAKDDAAAAMTLIGELFRDGLGFRQDQAEAVRWYQLASNRGDRQATFALARAYLEGRGVKQDEGKARALFEEAAAKGHGGALYNLGIMAIGNVSQDKPGDFKSAASYFAKAQAAGDLDATYSLAVLYRRGNGVTKDDVRATALLKEAADDYHLGAMAEYAIALFNGTGTTKDEAAAATYFTRAAWKNSPIAQNRLARMYAAGSGVKKDMVEAMKWHIIARASGIKDAWLDDQLPFLTRTQREIVDQQVRKFAGK